jgi:hypothetical protein
VGPRAGVDVEETCPLPGIDSSFLVRPAHSLVFIPTELSRLQLYIELRKTVTA